MCRSYPFPDGPTSKKQLIAFISEIVYPGDASGKKRVREHIRYNIKIGELPEIGNRIEDPAAFFAWAIRQKRWRRLRTVEGLPLRFTRVVAGHESPYSLLPPSPQNLSDDIEQIRHDYGELYALLEACNTELQTVRTELSELKAADKRRRENCGRRPLKDNRQKIK